MTKDQFDCMLIWAREKPSTGQEPPWAWFQYLKLEETLGSILSGMAASIPLGSLQSDLCQERHLDKWLSSPLDISSPSTRVNASLDRARAGGRIPPVRDNNG